MENDELRQELVERYLDGLMTEQEVEDFETQLRHDKVLGEALDDERLVRAAAQQARARELRGKMRQWRQEGYAKQQNPSFSKLRFTKPLLIVASIVGVLLLCWTFFKVLVAPDPQPEQKRPTGPTAAQEQVDSLNVSKSTPQNELTALPQAKTLPLSGKKDDAVKNKKPTTSPNTKQLANSNLATQKTDSLPLAPIKIVSEPITNTLATEKVRTFVHSKFVRAIGDGPTRTAANDSSAFLNPKTRAADALRKNNFEDALYWLRQVDTTDIGARRFSAEALFGAGRYDEAARVFQDLSNHLLYGLDAQKNEVLCNLAQYPLRQDAYERGIEQLLNSKSPSVRKWAEDLEAELKKVLR